MSTLAAKARMLARLTMARLPDTIAARLRPAAERFVPGDVPQPATADPNAPVRLLIAPANFAGQARQWARAAETLPGVSAANLQVRAGTDFGFAADVSVPAAVAAGSRTWALRQRASVPAQFTHVLIEAGRPVLGNAFDGVVEREARWLLKQSVRVGLISHGTDLRSPRRHAQIDRWSPFHTADPAWVAELERKAQHNRRLFERLGVPAFVSTPELLEDWPAARWLPLVIDPAQWRAASPPLERSRPVVLHAPTNPLVKGTALIEPVLERLDADGTLAYRRVQHVPADAMPALFADADIVLDQFALGIYSATAVEAMAAGRLVLAHLHDQVREQIREVTGLEAPVIEATPETLQAVLRDIVARPDHYSQIAARGPAYVDAVHDGALSARVLADFLGVHP